MMHSLPYSTSSSAVQILHADQTATFCLAWHPYCTLSLPSKACINGHDSATTRAWLHRPLLHHLTSFEPPYLDHLSHSSVRSSDSSVRSNDSYVRSSDSCVRSSDSCVRFACVFLALSLLPGPPPTPPPPPSPFSPSSPRPFVHPPPPSISPPAQPPSKMLMVCGALRCITLSFLSLPCPALPLPSRPFPACPSVTLNK